MPAEKFANTTETTLSAAVDAVATSIAVAAAAPVALQGGQFRVRVDDELMLVTATGAAGASPWTVVRGAEGTTAATHASAAKVTHVLTATSVRTTPHVAWMPANAKIESAPRGYFVQQGIPLVSGQILLFGGATLLAGQTVTSITFVTETPGTTTATNQWFCLVDQDGNVLAKTVDDLTAAWNAYSFKTLSLQAPFAPVSDTPVYIGCMAAFTGTTPDLYATTPGGTLLQVPPRYCALTTATGLTGPESVGATVTFSLSSNQRFAYCYAS